MLHHGGFGQASLQNFLITVYNTPKKMVIQATLKSLAKLAPFADNKLTTIK